MFNAQTDEYDAVFKTFLALAFSLLAVAAASAQEEPPRRHLGDAAQDAGLNPHSYS